jgi:hypothetical protein
MTEIKMSLVGETIKDEVMYSISVMIRIQTRKHDDAMQNISRREGRKKGTMTSS